MSVMGEKRFCVICDKDASNPIIADKNEGEYTNPDGTIFAVIGTAGADLHNFTGQAPYVVKQFQGFGFLDVNITSDGKIMKGTFYKIEMAQIKTTLQLRNN